MLDKYEGKPLNGPNDVWVRPDGALYFTDPFYQRSWWTYDAMPQDGEHVYFLSADRRHLVRVTDDLEKPNGIIGTPDGKTLYVADIGAGKTYRYEIAPDGDLTRKTLVAEHGSDGMTLDNEGNLYLTGDGVAGVRQGGPADRADPDPRRALDGERQLLRQGQANALHHGEHRPVPGQDAGEGCQPGKVTTRRDAHEGHHRRTEEARRPRAWRISPSPTRRGGSVLVEAIAVGVCGTDVEIVEGKYGWAPPGKTRLVLGHESLGRVVDPGPGGALQKGDLVVGIVRRPDPVPCPNCAVGEWDMCRNGQYTERGIKQIDGYMSERWRIEPEYAMKIDRSLGLLGVLLEPTTVVTKAWEQVVAVGQRAFWEPRTVLVTGAGPIGLLAALVGKQRGLEVHVLDRVESGPKPELVRALGATYHTGTVGGRGLRSPT